ncbi:nuclear transport factor 2 family protein [Nonlabens xiamenensis]|uniref:nuclear transport factor 2 family protein n=1 Tax=Nonlabens xiamenensis TaxID=2341043 RepID=UPI000F60F5F0|nr:nuclear transport factor 2 family protein [Nonlabens xiamenensis]
MAVSAKKIVKEFLDSDVFVNTYDFEQYLHPELKVHWHASSGFRVFDYDDYHRLCQSTANSYESMRNEISHIFSNKNEVAARFTVYVRTVENPREEIPVGYFISIFKIDDEKIIEVHQTSHPAEQQH